PGHSATEPGKGTRKSQIYLASLHPVRGAVSAGHGATGRRDRNGRCKPAVEIRGMAGSGAEGIAGATLFPARSDGRKLMAGHNNAAPPP
ncbi:hypothetical protein YF03_004872, partial [Salmonella enterica subsp. enterica serovar Oranienburg]|nr:hypothetical protein [Salmonella enterica subsp. enterica serovar Enteritidis]EDV2543721.1 hypothetical protein [Salmonella enterica subsp. enterica serovar Oranienburg]